MLEDFFIITNDLTIHDIQFYPIFELKQCATCKQIFLVPAGSNFQYHIAKDHYGYLETLNVISINDLKEYKINGYYPKELEMIIEKYKSEKK
jgi:hypothetical protein